MIYCISAQNHQHFQKFIGSSLSLLDKPDFRGVLRNPSDIYDEASLHEKCPNAEFFSGIYFPVPGLNEKIYGVNLRIQSKYGKMQTRKNSVFGHFSRSAFFYEVKAAKVFCEKRFIIVV